MEKKCKFSFKAVIALVLCVTMVVCGLPVGASTAIKKSETLYDNQELQSKYLSPTDNLKKEYPNGALMFPIASATLKMDKFYAFPIFRQGGTKGETTVNIQTVDYSACYGVNYEIYLSNEYGEKAVDGKANPFYSNQDFSFIPVVTHNETAYASNETNDKTDIKDARSAITKMTNESTEAIPTSSNFDITFKDGESQKMIYIATKKDDVVTADLEFSINIKNADNASLGVQTSTAITIDEEREIPETQVQILDTKVNPESDEAYVVVARGGNLGTYVSYRVVTKSKTAKAGEDYQATQMQLDFIPGMTEQKIPVKMLDGAEDKEYFTVELDNVKNAKAINNSATVEVTQTVKKESVHENAFVSAIEPTKSTERGKLIVPGNSFQKDVYTNRGCGKQYPIFENHGDHLDIGFHNAAAAKNNGFAVRSKEKIDFTGVDYISWVIDNYTGSCSWDHNAIYVSDSPKFDSDTSNYDFLDSLASDKVGCNWNMINVSDGHIVNSTPILDQSKVRGEHYLYMTIHKGSCGGTAEFKVFTNGNTTDNILLHMTEYNMTIKNPDEVKILKDGSMVNVLPAKNLEISDPGASSKDDSRYSTSTKIYREEQTVIKGVIDESLEAFVRLKGVVLCDPDSTSKTSELIPLSSSAFTLTSEILKKYSEFIKDKKIIIKPVYSIDNATLEVEDFDNRRSDTDGQRFTINSDGFSGTFYNDGKEIGTLYWTKPDRDNENYLVTDTVNFQFEPCEGVDASWINLKFTTRSGTDREMAQSATIVTRDTGTLSAFITLDNRFVSVTPEFTKNDAETMLIVKNPNKGTVDGNYEKFKKTDEETKAIVIRGYTTKDGRDIEFNKMSLGSVITFGVTPNEGYRAKWHCTDSITNDKKVYYGNSFFYAIQNPYRTNDNIVTVEFEKINQSRRKTVQIYGKTFMQEGSVLHMPSAETTKKNILPNASVTVDKYMGISDENGEFTIVNSTQDTDQTLANIDVSNDETIRVLVMANNQYYIDEINVSDYNIEENPEINIDLNLKFNTYGAKPKSIQAVDDQGNLESDSIPLVTAQAVKFDLTLDTTQQDKNAPVNMVRWTIEHEDGVVYSYDNELEKGATNSHFANQISEIAKPGEKLYVELFNKSYNDKAEEVYKTYGKYNTGYNFIAMSVQESVTYAPDLGVPSTMALPAPVLGPISPLVSFKGLLPIFDIGSTIDDQGREIKTVTLGINFGKLSNQAAKDKSFKSASPLDKGKKLGSILDEYGKQLNDTGTLPKFAGKNGMANMLNMGTTVALSFSVTLCYQGSYYVDEETGAWQFVSNIAIIGAGGKIRVSVPFTFFYIPCFTFVTAELGFNAYFGMFPTTDETGTSMPLTLTQLDDSNKSKMQGVYEFKGSFGFGVGIGFDALLSASGNITTTIDIQLNDYGRGVGNLSMSGGIMLEMLFLKYSWSEQIFKIQLFNTLNDNKALRSSLDDAFTQDLLNSVSLGDLEFNKVEANSSGKMLANRRATLSQPEKVVAESNALVKPSVEKIGNDKYLITTVKYEEIDGLHSQKLYYYIYDENQNSITEEGFVLEEALKDLIVASELESSAKELESLKTQITNVDTGKETIDNDVELIDCGDEIMLMWIKASEEFNKNQNNADMIKSVGLATLFYNKATGEFHDYKFFEDTENDSIFLNPKAVYNKETKSVQVFYESLNAENITNETTMAQIQQMTTTLQTFLCINVDDEVELTNTTKVAISDNALNYYDVATRGDKNVLAFVGSPKAGFTLDSIEDFDIDGNIDIQDFNTVNSLYIQQFSTDNNTIEPSDQVKITGDDFVTANPNFAHINTDNVDNLLLFYKCNGEYAYQNIDTLYHLAMYEDENGNTKMSDSYLEPQFITSEDDYNVNDDLKIISDDKTIYALWTTAEGDQQQIWSRSFYVDALDKIEGDIKRDSNGNAIYDENGNVELNKFDEPVYLLKGDWGGDTYLTEGGVNGSENGKFKKDFDAIVTDDGALLTVFNAYDIAYGNQNNLIANNNIIIAEYESKTDYEMVEDADQITFSNSYPSEGETIEVNSIIKNTGIKNGRDVKATLYVNGQAYAENRYDHWLTDESKSIDFNYTLPSGVKAEDVSMYVELSENGAVKYTTDSYNLETGVYLVVQTTAIEPIQNIGKNYDSAKYNLQTTIKNIGNVDYENGLYLKLVENDVENLMNAMKDESNKDEVVYTIYGTNEIPSIKAGEVAVVGLNSDEIPKEVFEKNAGGTTARLETFITNADNLDKKTYQADEKINIMSEYFPGLTMKAMLKSAKTLNVSNVTLQAGTSANLTKEVSPKEALIEGVVSYKSSNEKVATVNGAGVVTGYKVGTCEITSEIDGVKTTSTVTVTKEEVKPTEPTKPTNPNEPTEPSEATNPEEGSTNGSGEQSDVTTGEPIIPLTFMITLVMISGFIVLALYKKRERQI